MSTVHWSVEIDLGDNSINDSELCIKDGILYMATDGYDPATHASTYEDGSLVINYGDVKNSLLSESPLSGVTQSVDIINGGDYSFGGDVAVTFGNFTWSGRSLAKALFQDYGVRITENNIKVFLVYNNVFYQRWTGVTDSIERKEDELVWSCKDKLNSDNIKYTNGTIGDITFELSVKQRVENPTPINEFIPYNMLPSFSTYTGAIEPVSFKPVVGYDYLYRQGESSNVITSTDTFVEIEISSNTGDTSNWEYISFHEKGDEKGVYSKVTNIRVDGDRTFVQFDLNKKVASEITNFFGGYEGLPTGEQPEVSLIEFDGTIVKIWDNSVEYVFPKSTTQEMIDSITIDGVLVSGGIYGDETTGFWMEPNTTISVVKRIENTDIKWYQDTIVGSENVVDRSDYTEQFDGLFSMNDPSVPSEQFYQHALLNIDNAKSQLGTLDGYSKVYFGNRYRMEAPLQSLPMVDIVSSFLGYDTEDSSYTSDMYFIDRDGVLAPISKTYGHENDITSACLVDGVEVELLSSTEHKSDDYDLVINYDGGDSVVNYRMPFGIFLDGVAGENDVDFKTSAVTNLPIGYTGIHDLAPVGEVNMNNNLPTYYNYYDQLSEVHYGTWFESVYDIDGAVVYDIKDKIDEESYLLLNINAQMFTATQVIRGDYSGGGWENFTVDGGQNMRSSGIYADFFLVGEKDITANSFLVTVSDQHSSNVHTAIMALTDFAGNYDRLVNRSNWHVGAYFEEAIPKSEIITNLCRTSQVIGFTSRKGIPTFSTFRDASAQTHLHDDLITIEESVTDYSTTTRDDVFNEFDIKLGGSGYIEEGAFEGISIANVDKDTFPAEDEYWQEYVDGLSDTTENYNYAKTVWESAHDAYLKTLVVSSMPNTYTDCKYGVIAFPDDENSNYATLCLERSIEWATKLKYTIPYSLPITDSTVKVEVGDIVLFSDAILTDGLLYAGWVTSLSFEDDDTISIEVTSPIDTTDEACVHIVEGRQGADTIDEQDGNTDYIDEGNC